MSVPVTSRQDVVQMSGYPKLSGRPQLRSPSTIGVLTTRRTDAIEFTNGGQGGGASRNIRAIYPIQSFCGHSSYYQMSDVLANRAKIIQDAKFLGLDVIVVCDQETQKDDDFSLSQIVTLGLVDLSMKKQQTKLTVLAMDARTGYIYGVMGREKDGRAGRLALVGSDMLGDPARSHVVKTARNDAIQQFPAFWDQVVAQYQRRK